MSEDGQIVLPDGFIRAEYLESTGTQYLSLPITTKAGDSVVLETECKFNDTIVQADGKNGNPYFFFGINNGKWWCGAGSYSTSSIAADKNWHQIKLIHSETESGLFIDGNKILSQTYNSSGVLLNGYISIFNETVRNYFCKNSKKNWRLYVNDELVYDLIPCIDDNGIGCMYDLVTKQSFYNKGTGSFDAKIFIPEDKKIGVIGKLPEGFTKLNCLVANGKQWIDTGYVPTNETGYYLEGQGYATDTTARNYFGMRETTISEENDQIYIGATPNVNWAWMTNGTLTNTAAYLRQETKISHNFLNDRVSKATINETDFTYDLPELNFIPSKTVYLFGSNVAGENTANLLMGRIDTFKISEKDKIVRHFIPCLDADNIPCMYELCTGWVHYNRGNLQFSYPKPYKLSRYEIPADFKRCVYLQSNGTQYIDTGVKPNNKIGLLCKTNKLDSSAAPFFGVRDTSSTAMMVPYINGINKNVSFRWKDEGKDNLYTLDKGDDYIFTSCLNFYNDRFAKIDSEDTDWFIPVTTILEDYTQNIWLFSSNFQGSFNATNGAYKGRIFRAQITQGDELIHDYVPCLDDNNKPCMFDLITQETLYNQGTGEDFDYCIEHKLPNNFIKLKYLENTDKQYIKTGYIPTNTTGLYLEGYNTVVADTAAMGMQNTTGNDRVWIGGVMSATYGARYGWGAITTPGGNGSVRFIQTLNWLNNKKSIIDCPAFAQKVNTLSNLSFTPSKDIAIFGYNQNGKVNSWKGRVYRAKISEGDTIVRDFIPAWDDLKQRPCLYDLVENKPYYNDGEGEFGMNDDREGTYTGFTFFGCIGNRLGGLFQ